jgi:S1-C subfamily serine protease
MGSRAAIELESKGITLAFTFLPEKRCRNDAFVILKLKNAGSRSMKTGAIVELQVDNEPPKEMPAEVIQEGDGWRFYDVSEDFPVEDLFGRSTATLTLRGEGFFYLPLMGFHEAWKRARTLCEPYIFSGRSQAIHEPQTNISEFDSIMVKRIQVELSGLGYDPGPADGVFGPRTEEAIRSFQSDNKLPPTGKPSAELAIVISALNTTMVTESESRERSTIVRSGTGFVVSNDRLLLTSQHVVENCEEVLVNIPPGQQRKGTFVAASKDLDLALLRVEGNTADSAHFREGRGVRPGEDIMVFGFPLSGALASSGNVTRGTVTALAGIGNDPNTLQISAPVQSGNSGGAVLDKSGNVVGVVSSKLDAVSMAALTGELAQNVNFAIKRTTVLNFLDAHGVAYYLRPSRSELQPAEIAEEARRFTYKVDCLR